MARLPDLDSLGNRPTPQPVPAVVQVRNAGATGAAVADVGNAIQNVGEQMLAREDKLSYAAAKSAVLRADVATRSALQDDPDYLTYEQRYTEAMSKARETAASLIKSKTDRRLFDIDAQGDMDRGMAEVSGLALQKRRASRTALGLDTLNSLQGTARAATDDATREQSIQTAHDVVQGMIDGGDIDPVRGVELRQNWASNYIKEQIAGKLDAGDIAGAKALHQSMGAKYLDSNSYTALQAAIDSEADDHIVLNAADIATGAAGGGGPTTGPMPLPAQGKVTSPFGHRAAPKAGASTEHNGVDIAVPVGSPVEAPSAGKVVKVWNDTAHGGGLSVQIDHGGGVITGYAHLASQDVKEGDTIQAGQVIGKSGATGNATGPNLHWTMRVNGKAVDPISYRPPQAPVPQTLDEAIRVGIAALGPNASTKQIDGVRKEVTTRFQIAKADREQREENTLNGVQQALVANGGNWFALPASVRSGVPAKYVPSLINFGDTIRSGQQPKTDPEEFVRLSTLAATNPQQFAAINPIEYHGKLDNGDWESFVGLRAKILGKPDDNGVNQTSIGEINSVTDPMLKAQGLTLDGIRATDTTKRQAMAGRIYNFQKSVAGDLQVWQQNNPGKKPTVTDIQAIADRRLIQVTLENGKTVPQFEAAGPGKVSIPSADRQRIASLMKNVLGRDPSPTEVFQAYIHEARGGM